MYCKNLRVKISNIKVSTSKSPAATGLLRGDHPPSGSLYIYFFKFTFIITYKFDLRAQILIVILHGATETVF